MCKIRSKATGPGWGRGRAEVTGLRSRKVNGSVTVLRWLIRPSLQLSVFLAGVCHMCGLWRGTNAGAAAPDAGAAAAIGAGPGAEVPGAAVPFHPAPGAATARPRGSGEAGRGVRGRRGACPPEDRRPARTPTPRVPLGGEAVTTRLLPPPLE